MTSALRWDYRGYQIEADYPEEADRSARGNRGVSTIAVAFSVERPGYAPTRFDFTMGREATRALPLDQLAPTADQTWTAIQLGLAEVQRAINAGRLVPGGKVRHVWRS